MVRLLSLFTVALLGSIASFGQHAIKAIHPAKKYGSTSRVTVADAAENNYDVKYVKLNLSVDNMSTHVSGDATTRAVVLSSSLLAYVFELDTLLTIDSVRLNGVLRPVTSVAGVRTVAFTTPITSGNTFTAQVYYHGTPRSGDLYNALGMNSAFDSNWYAHVTFSLSEPYDAWQWWPCKQALQDKIDSADIWITVPDSLKAGSNGVLQAVTTVDATHKRYEWKERKPIDYYLLSLAVAPYVDYSYYMHYTGSTDSTLVQNYIYNNPATLPALKPALDSTGLMMDYFSTLYGRYPFWKEKYGHSLIYTGGAMEHQTMTSLGSYAADVYTISHELGHQWFGDNVTCATWADIMMNEGFASYTSYLFADHFHDHYDAINGIYYAQEIVKTYDTGTVYTPDTSENRIFDGRLTYFKGECVLHMLRAVFNYDDTAFFRVFRGYQQQYGNGTATIEDFKNVAKSMYGTTLNGINLDTFFHQWVYREGFPIYSVRWNQVGSNVTVQLDQVSSNPASVPCFKLPVDMTLYDAISTNFQYKWVINNAPSQTYTFNWPYTTPMTDLYLDPAVWLVFDLDTVIHDPTLGVAELPFARVKVAPNPTIDQWTLGNLPVNTSVTLCDVTGRELWRRDNISETVVVPATNLATGLYLLRLTDANGVVATYKVVRA